MQYRISAYVSIFKLSVLDYSKIESEKNKKEIEEKLLITITIFNIRFNYINIRLQKLIRLNRSFVCMSIVLCKSKLSNSFLEFYFIFFFLR